MTIVGAAAWGSSGDTHAMAAGRVRGNRYSHIPGTVSSSLTRAHYHFAPASSDLLAMVSRQRTCNTGRVPGPLGVVAAPVNLRRHDEL